MSEFKKEGHPEFMIYRRRFIPDEWTCLKGDRIHLVSPEQIVTSWEVLRPRDDIAGGISVYYPKLGYKISKMYDPDHRPVYWYCDIIRLAFAGTRINYEDLLLDMVVYGDGSLRVLDADELAEALEGGLISQETACLSLRCLNHLLNAFYEGRLGELQQPVFDAECILFPEGWQFPT